MAEDIKNVNIEEEEEDIITLEFDDDTAVDCYVMGTFELDGKEYIALEPEDGTGDVYIYGYKQVSDDEFEILEIESEEEFDAAAAESKISARLASSAFSSFVLSIRLSPVIPLSQFNRQFFNIFSDNSSFLIHQCR